MGTRSGRGWLVDWGPGSSGSVSLAESLRASGRASASLVCLRRPPACAWQVGGPHSPSPLRAPSPGHHAHGWLSLPVCVFHGPGPEQPRVRLRPGRGRALTEPLPRPPHLVGPLCVAPVWRVHCAASGAPSPERGSVQTALPPGAPSAAPHRPICLPRGASGSALPHGGRLTAPRVPRV